MSDSPKCQKCLDLGLVGQTYKVAGKANFQCRDCKTIYRQDEFEPEEFLWKDNTEKWKSWKNSKKLKPQSV